MRNWIKRLIWPGIVALVAFAFQVVLYLILSGDPVEIVGDKVKMFSFGPTFLVYAAIWAGVFAVLAGFADLKYDWTGQLQRRFNKNNKTVEIVWPNLFIDYKEGEQSYQQWDPSENDKHWLLHRFRIFNKEEKLVKNVIAQIDNIIPLPISEIRGLPIKLQVMGQDEPPLRNKPSFNLNGKSGEFIDLIALGQREIEPNTLLYPVGSYPTPQSILLSNKRDYKIKVTIFANGTKYCEKIFLLMNLKKNPNTETRHQLMEA